MRFDATILNLDYPNYKLLVHLFTIGRKPENGNMPSFDPKHRRVLSHLDQ